jgi:hypothetical protein
MTPDRDNQAKGFHGEAAEDKGGARGGSGEQYERGDAQEKAGRHDEQTRVFHSLSLSGFRPMEFDPPHHDLGADPQCLCFVTEDNRLECLYEF